MLRTLAFALVLAAPSMAFAQHSRDPLVGQEVRGAGGVVIGRVAAVERDADGRVIAVEIPGLEPAHAPRAPVLVAERRQRRSAPVQPISARERQRAANAATRAR